MIHTPASVKILLKQGMAAIGLMAVLAISSANADQPTPALRGQLLIAADTMADPRFQQTVIYIADHEPQAGTLGLVLNQPMGDMPIAELLNGIGAETETEAKNGNILAYYGGPVEPSRIFLILPPPDITETDALPSPAVITALDNVVSIINDEDRPAKSMFMLGYAGWSPGQLEAELAAGDWHIIPFDEALVFSGEFEQMWSKAVQRRAVDL